MKPLNLLPLALCGTQAALAFKVRRSRGSSSRCQTPRSLEQDSGLRTHSCGRTSATEFFSSLQVTHPVGVGFDCVVKAPLLLSHCSFAFGVRGSFLVGSSLFACGCSAVSCDLGVF